MAGTTWADEGHAGHSRRDFIGWALEEEFVDLPTLSVPGLAWMHLYQASENESRLYLAVQAPGAER